MNNSNKNFLKGVASQATGIIIAALGAALITFLQSILSSTGACDIVAPSTQEAGVLGATIKGGHSAFQVARGTMKI